MRRQFYYRQVEKWTLFQYFLNFLGLQNYKSNGSWYFYKIWEWKSVTFQFSSFRLWKYNFYLQIKCLLNLLGNSQISNEQTIIITWLSIKWNQYFFHLSSVYMKKCLFLTPEIQISYHPDDRGIMRNQLNSLENNKRQS